MDTPEMKVSRIELGIGTEQDIKDLQEIDLPVPEEEIDFPVPGEEFPPSALFKEELEHLINRYCKENGSDTPDFILANFLLKMLDIFDETVSSRERWYGRESRSFSMHTVSKPDDSINILDRRIDVIDLSLAGFREELREVKERLSTINNHYHYAEGKG